MAANLKNSRKGVKPSTSSTARGTRKVVDQAMAVQMLASAIGYLQMCGLQVKAEATPSGLVLTIPKLICRVSGDSADFALKSNAPAAETPPQAVGVIPVAVAPEVSLPVAIDAGGSQA